MGNETIYMISILVILLFTLFSSLYMLVKKELQVGFRFLALVVFIIALWLLFRRDTFLPFLGSAALPMSLLVNDVAPDGANKEITINVDALDGTRLMYWGAKENDAVQPNPWVAYDDYSNAGVTTVRNGKATIRFYCPGSYYVPSGKRLDRHLHYRLCCSKNVMLGPVQTIWVKCS